MTEPLIYTTRGNLPISSLKYSTKWEDTPDYTKLIESYEIDGEVVRQSVHVFGRKPLDLTAQQAQM